MPQYPGSVGAINIKKRHEAFLKHTKRARLNNTFRQRVPVIIYIYNTILTDKIINNFIGKQYIFEGSGVFVSSPFHTVKKMQLV